MQDGTLRRVLQMETRDLHETLDRGIGAFADGAGYRAFLGGSYAFRAAIEPRLQDGDWPVQPLAPLIARDLADLDRPRPPIPAAPALDSAAARAAACYVLEGSTLGARLLVRRAAGLGYSADHGARHLAAQTAAPARWRQFLDWLEAGRFAVPEAVAAARDVFALALRAHGVRMAA